MVLQIKHNGRTVHCALSPELCMTDFIWNQKRITVGTAYTGTPVGVPVIALVTLSTAIDTMVTYPINRSQGGCSALLCGV